MTKEQLQTTALQLKAFLTVFAAVDPDNMEALAELPNALQPAAELAEALYNGLIDMK